VTALDAGLLDPATTDAADLVGDAAVLAAMVDAEAALLAALAEEGAAPESAKDITADRLTDGPLDLAAIAAASRGSGNPVIPLLAELRRRSPAELRDVLHTGATSQDVLDTALLLVADRARQRIRDGLALVIDRLAELADTYRHTPAVARTLAQQAAPTTAGLRFAVLLDGVLRARTGIDELELPAQLGGSVGTLAVLADLLGPERAVAVREAYARRLGLATRPTVWHVERSAIAGLGAALAVLLGALGRIGLETAQGSREELGELSIDLPAGEGGSSAMPQKRNPVPAVLLVAAARRAPGLASTLLGAQLALDDRPPGDWHSEWQPLRELLRLALEATALAQTTAVALTVDAQRMREHLADTGGAVHAERAQWALVPVVGRARAAELVRDALATGDLLPALLRAVEADPRAAAAADRIRAVTAVGGPVGLSDTLIDAALDAARSSR
jgi:3-carboxy-cis,cis-muconate cycloisomerase